MKLDKGIPRDIVSVIEQSEFKLAPGAMKPLRRIDFAKLVAIHDHEEHFLRTTFIDTLLALRRARVSTGSGGGKITADDVETAILMLGTASARQANETLSKETRRLIRDACPFC